MAKKATGPLEPGEHNIDNCTPYASADGSSLLLDWYLRDGVGRLHKKRSQAPAGTAAGVLRRRAKAKAAELLKTSGDGAWKATRPMVDYIDQVTLPLIENAPDQRLKPNTRARYLLVLQWIRAEFKGLSIGSATRFRAQEQAIQAIAAERGRETGRQARNVIGKYINQQLIRDELLNANPLAGMDIDLGSVKKTTKPAGGVALRLDEYQRAVNALLEIDPAEGIKPRQGRYSVEQRVAKVAGTVDALLIGSATGLRIGEILSLDWEDVQVDKGEVAITVTPEKSKTRKGRTVPVLDGRVAKRIVERQTAGGTGFVVGSPTDPQIQWDRDNAQKAVTAQLRRLGDELSIETLRTHGSHVWRATLNTLLAGKIPDAQRAAFFGHDVAINRTAYTDTTDVSGMVGAFKTTTSPTTLESDNA